MYRFDVRKNKKLYYNYQDTTDEVESLERLKSTTIFENGDKIIIYKRVNGNGLGVSSRAMSAEKTILPTAFEIEEELSEGVYSVEWKPVLIEKIDNFFLKVLLLLLPVLLIYWIVQTFLHSFIGLVLLSICIMGIELILLFCLVLFTPFRIVWALGITFGVFDENYGKPKFKKKSEFKISDSETKKNKKLTKN